MEIVPPPAQLEFSWCVLWEGNAARNGYGQFRLNGRQGPNIYVHRIAYEAEYGPIPLGLEVHHLCGVRTCINPQHMKLLTKAEHARLHQAGRPRRTWAPEEHPLWPQILEEIRSGTLSRLGAARRLRIRYYALTDALKRTAA
jgi:hypothetical protein